MSRTERHEIVYQCDHCSKRDVAYDSVLLPPSDRQKRLSPEGWFKVTGPLRYATNKVVVTVDLCSATCLQAWAGKQGGEGG